MGVTEGQNRVILAQTWVHAASPGILLDQGTDIIVHFLV